MNRIEVLKKGYEPLAEFLIYGQPPRKSNQRQIVTRGRSQTKRLRPMIIKSKEARAYMDSFSDQVPEQYRDKKYGSLEEDLRLDVTVWYKDRRPDLSIELIKDCIEKAGVIKNDRYIREEHIYGFVDKKTPRIAIRLWRVPSTRLIPFEIE